MSDTNRNSKDRLFRFIFGQKDHPEWTLSLYNAVNGSHYTNPDDIRMTTIDDVVYMSMKNDLSFLIANTMNFYEHQSTVNPNMPIRMLIYAGMVYSKHVEDKNNRVNLYSSKQQMLPVPKLICFYNGEREQPDETILELNTAFPEGTASDISVRVRMLNINDRRNQKLQDASEPLKEYVLFITEYRQQRRNGTNEDEAIASAIRKLPEGSRLRKYLEANRAEVKRMCITEYDEAWTMELFREEGREEGRAEGREEGLEKGKDETSVTHIRNLMARMSLTAEKAMEILGISAEDQHKYALMLKEADSTKTYDAQS